jgi:hypothetical protein
MIRNSGRGSNLCEEVGREGAVDVTVVEDRERMRGVGEESAVLVSN